MNDSPQKQSPLISDKLPNGSPQKVFHHPEEVWDRTPILSRMNSMECWDYTIELECLNGPQGWNYFLSNNSFLRKRDFPRSSNENEERFKTLI